MDRMIGTTTILGRIHGIVEQIDRWIEQLVVAGIPLRDLLADLQCLANSRAGVGLPGALASQNGKQRVVVGDEILVA